MNVTARELQSFLADYREEIRESAFELIGEEMPVLRPEDFGLYEKTGNRLIYEGSYFPRRKFLAILGMEAIIEAEETDAVDGAILHRLCGVLEKICAEETWALPAHVNRQENPAWRETVDLFASETAQTLAELLDRLHTFLPEHIKDIMEAEINRRVMEPYFLSRPPYAWWEAGKNNWAAVCAGSIGSACIHLANAGRRLIKPLSDCLDRVCAVMPYYFLSFTDDGACMEGLQYYTYGMTYFANFAWEVRELTGKNLFERPDIAAFPAKCFFKDGVSLSFSDGSKNDTFRVGLQALQALMYGDAFFPPMERAARLHSDTCYRFAGLKLDWFATKEYLNRTNGTEEADKETRSISAALKSKDRLTLENEGKNLKPELSYRFHILPFAQWCIGYAKDGTGFACKGGHNGEPHNHNDTGHFIYEAEGVLFLTDLGAGEYTKDYFSSGRYHFVCNHSFGHSVPILNGQGQRAGEAYRCTAFSAGVEKKSGADTQRHIWEQDMSAGTVAINMEFGSAYSLSEDGAPLSAKAIQREICFDLETGELDVTDSFDVESAGDVSENLVTQILPVIDGNRVYLKQNGAAAMIEIDAAAGASSPDITVVTYDHKNHEGTAEKVYGIRWPVPLSKGRGRASFTVRRYIPGET